MSVSSVSSVSDALKYINGIDVVEEESSIVSDVSSCIFNPVTAVFGASQATSTLKSTLGASSVFKSAVNKETGETAKSAVGLLKDYKKSGRLLNAAGETVTLNTSKKLGSQFSSAVESAVSKADTKTAEKIANAGKGFFASIKSGIKTAGKTVSNVVSKIPGVSTIVNKAAGGLKWFSNTTAGKVFKGTGAIGIMAIDGIMGVFTEVIPAFQQGGVKSGFKQLAKTGVKTLASGAGWAGGIVSGQAIGAAVGSIFGPVGTIVGGALGKFFGGMVGSTICTGIAKKITGDSETEILQDQQFDTAAQQVAVDSDAMAELGTLVTEKVQSDIANGTADENTELMASYINAGLFSALSPASYTNTTSNDNTSSTEPSAVQSAVTDANYWSEMAEKSASGDTSIYDISDEDLASIFSSSSTSSGSTGTDDIVKYFE